ncbi:hypothetical protein F4779DRAFT_103914 [Xylariaceae sp. FL0662B]|nr:hypothetical protein F4779DRAFT_103914 [Xylariaceae sp. FL0662B]
MVRTGLVALAFVALAQSAPVSEPTKTVKPRQFTWGDPGTWFGGGNEQPPAPAPITTILPPIVGGLNPSDKRQDNTIGLIGGAPDETKAKIIALELELEKLLQTFGAHAPWPVAQRIDFLEAELLKYGITVVQSPDGTTTTFVPGKRDVEGSFPGGPLVPENPYPGGRLTPDPTVPGGPIEISN